MKNEIDFVIESVQTSPLYIDEFGVPVGTYDVKVTLQQNFSKQDFEKVIRIFDFSKSKATLTLSRKIDELNKYTDEEILEYLRTRNNDNH